MSSTHTVKLLPGAINVQVDKETHDKETHTTLTFNAAPWGPHKVCIHKVLGQWEIQHINKHLVTLVNHNQIIKEP